MTRIYLFILISLSLFSCNSSNNFSLKDGDILFQDLDCGVYCESIETVTLGYKGANLSHCGIVFLENDQAYVLEAISKGVSKTLLDSFLVRSKDQNGKPKVLVGRLNKENEDLISVALKRAFDYLGKDYDAVYDLKNNKMYCSELVYFSFTNEGEFLFDLNPMTFKAENSDSTFAAWETYFLNLQIPIPEGELGLNPGSISLSKNIEIVHQFGQPDGMLSD